MKFRHIYILFTALLLLITACSDEQPVPGSGNAPQTELIPLHFNVSGFAVAETRGTVADQEGSLSEVGVFLMSQSEYEALLAGDVVYDGDNTLNKSEGPVSYPYYHNLENIEPYNAERNNIKFTVDDADNTLAPVDSTLKLYYSTTGGTVVFAYAPYRDGMTKEMLFQPGSVSVPEDQSNDDVVNLNDFYLATPVMKGAATGNPVNWYHKYITLEFRHQYARIVLASNDQSLQNMCWDLAEDADSVKVFVKDIPTSGTREVDSLGANFQYDIDIPATGRIFMASYSLAEGMPDTITSTALVLPSQKSVMPRFGLVFYRGEEELKTVSLSVRGSDKNVVLSRGMSKTFSCNYGEEDKLRDAFTRGLDYTLSADVDLAEPLILEEGKSMTLDLNGHTISMEKECTGSYNMITNRGSLTIVDNPVPVPVRSKVRSAANGDAAKGRISFKDTGSGDNTFVWGSYTINNCGTLTVEGGVIENLSEHNANGSVVHMYCTINQSSGTTIVNGGTVSNPTYRSIRINRGALIVNGGVMEGQVWLQPNLGDATIEVSGGDFSPSGVDGPSIFMANTEEDYTVSSAKITGGTFRTDIGSNDPTKEGVKGCIKGGTFTETAKDNTNAALIAEGYDFVSNGDGTYSLQPSVGLTDEKANSEFEALSRRNGKR